MLYRIPVYGEFNQTFVLTIWRSEGNTPTLVLKQDDKEVVIHTKNLLPTLSNRKAKMLLQAEPEMAISNMVNDLEVLVLTPLSEIK